MNNINKNKIIIAGIIILMLIVIIMYIYSLRQQNTNDYEELEITETQPTEENKINSIKVHIAGSVVNEGIVELEEGARVADAIKEAGGTTADANLDKINLAYKLQDGQKIYIPNQNEDEEEIFTETESTNTITEINKTDKININTATQAELELLPGIGPSTALKIINYRNENGNFKTIEDIKNVSGIGDAKFANIEDQITV